MDISKSIIIAAIIVSFSIIVSPVVLQKYKMVQCVSAIDKVGLGTSSATESTCMQYIK